MDSASGHMAGQRMLHIIKLCVGVKEVVDTEHDDDDGDGEDWEE